MKRRWRRARGPSPGGAFVRSSSSSGRGAVGARPGPRCAGPCPAARDRLESARLLQQSGPPRRRDGARGLRSQAAIRARPSAPRRTRKDLAGRGLPPEAHQREVRGTAGVAALGQHRQRPAEAGGEMGGMGCARGFPQPRRALRHDRPGTAACARPACRGERNRERHGHSSARIRRSGRSSGRTCLRPRSGSRR